MFFYLLQEDPTCFGHISWPSSGTYKFGRREQRVWQIFIDSCRL